jgi:peptidoglycan/xylan/chitin deacetylase (PgdA/CDA1 family)
LGAVLLHQGARLKNALKHLAAMGSWVPPGARVVFNMHDISCPDEPTFSPSDSTPPGLFERQLDFLQERFRFVELEDLLQERSSSHPRASLTFDDGFATVLSRAREILRKRKIPYAVFCSRRAIEEGLLDFDPKFPAAPQGSGKIFLDAADLLHLHAEGVLIGSHGKTHSALANLSPSAALEEVADNKTYLEALLGAPVNHFAFPYGKASHFDQTSVDICRSVGHKFLYSGIPSYISGKGAPSKRVIPRVTIHLQDEPALHLLFNRLALRRLLGAG